MLKYFLVIIVMMCLTISLFSPSYASDFKLIVHEFACEEDQIIIHYSVRNYINFDRPNVTIVFKIIKEDKPIACEEIITTIPKGADGSDIEEFIMDFRCGEGSFHLESDIFHDEVLYRNKDRLDQFLTGCPGYNK